MKIQRDSIITSFVITLIIAVVAVYMWSVISKERAEKAADNPATHALSVEEGGRPYTDLSGNPLSLTKHVGNVLVINSWASWSPDSAKELLTLAELSKNYRDQGVVVLAINRAESETIAKRFLETLGVIDDVQLALDGSDRFYRSSQGYSMPETVFYDRKGNVVYHHHGHLSYEQMKVRVEQILSSNAEEK